MNLHRRPVQPKLESLESRVVPVGDLDLAFGVSGIVRTEASPTREGDGLVKAFAQQDGKILTVGTAFGVSVTGFRPAFTRYLSDGGLDGSFGTNGFVYDIAGFSSISDAILQPDGKIIVIGATQGPGTLDFGVMRYNANGTRDFTFGNAFGSSGLARVDIDQGKRDFPSTVKIQSDGKIIVAGISTPEGSSDDQIALARFNSNGSLDTTFANQGTFRGTFSSRTTAQALAVEPSDGTIFVAGSVTRTGTGFDFALTRFNSSGQLDSSFGTGGLAAFHLGSGDTARELILQPDGKLVLAGEVGLNAGLVRVLADGSLDSTFGNAGIVVESFPDLGLGGVTVAQLGQQFNGKFILVGTTNTAIGGSREDFFLLRYQQDGSRDVSFGSEGFTNTDLFTGRDIPQSATLDGVGGILVVGTTNSPGDRTNDSVMVRYITNRAPIVLADMQTTAQATPVFLDVLANDSDLDGDTLAIVDIVQPAGGIVTVNADGTLTYTPGQFFTGVDTFTYTVFDGELFSRGSVQIRVTPASGPRVVDTTALRVGGLALAVVTFSEAIDASTFDVSDLVVRDAQGLVVRITGGDVVALNDQMFLIYFADPGLSVFSLSFGPDIRSAITGQLMNQDGDDVNGEEDDVFRFDFGI